MSDTERDKLERRWNPNPECPVCHGTGYPPGSKHPCDCWGYRQAVKNAMRSS